MTEPKGVAVEKLLGRAKVSATSAGTISLRESAVTLSADPLLRERRRRNCEGKRQQRFEDPVLHKSLEVGECELSFYCLRREASFKSVETRILSAGQNPRPAGWSGENASADRFYGSGRGLRLKSVVGLEKIVAALRFY